MHSFKKGLFLAEILLAVVIAAVIMGSSYLLYEDVINESNKNQAGANLSSLIVTLHTTYSEKAESKKLSAADYINESKTFAKSKSLPRSILIRSDMPYSVYDKPIIFGPTGYSGSGYTNGTSIYFLTYKDLNASQCAKHLKLFLKNKPLAIINGDFTHTISKHICVDRQSTRRLINKNPTLCSQPEETLTSLTAIYSPKQEQYLDLSPPCLL